MTNPAIKSSLAAALLAFGLAGCGADRAKDTPAPLGTDYRERHPITLGLAEETHSIIPNGRGRTLSPTQRRDLAVFIDSYRRQGRGALTVTSADDNRPANLDVAQVIRQAGVVPRDVLREYASADRIVLTYKKTALQVAHACGSWPDQLAPAAFPKPGELGTQWSTNASYYNYGCATQQAFAAQIADPGDYFNPPPESRIDGARRSTVYQRYRDGRDPSTQYRSAETPQTR